MYRTEFNLLFKNENEYQKYFLPDNSLRIIKLHLFLPLSRYQAIFLNCYFARTANRKPSSVAAVEAWSSG